MNAKPLETQPYEQPKGGMRYTYHSGSKPLDGYTIKRGVGRGGFGEVYFAVSDAGKEVALKLIRRNLDIELRGVTHCLNLKHPNLIAVYDIRSDEMDDRWVVMEFVSGESLEDAIEKHPNGMPVELAMKWFAGIAAGVAYLHDHGIVHRDLKPANIFIDEGTVKIGDYGLSKFISCSRRSGQTESVGTVHYMAPEIANGRYGKEIDTYALGIILYEMLTGHVPFEGESVGEVLMKHLTAEPDLQSLEDPYRELVRSAMAKDPDARFSSVSAMIEKLPVSVSAGSHGEAIPVAYPVAEEVIEAQVVSDGDEPIIAGIRRGYRDAENSIRQSNMHPLLKSVIAVVLIIGLVAAGSNLLGLIMVLGFVYLVYRAIRLLVVDPQHASSAIAPTMKPKHPTSGAPAHGKQAPPVAKPIAKKAGPKGNQNRRRRQSWQQHIQNHLAQRTMRDRVGDLLGSMLLSAIVAIIAAVLICPILLGSSDGSLIAWLTVTITLASWAVMVPGKLTEGRAEDQAPLRFTLLVSGALVGLLSWAAADTLMLPLPSSKDFSPGPHDTLTGHILQPGPMQELQNGFDVNAVQIPLQVFVGYFAILFVVLAWWRQGDYSRTSRVGIWRIVWCGLVAWMLHFLWWFPQPLGIITAAAVALAVQFSSPWMPPSKRRALSEAEA